MFTGIITHLGILKKVKGNLFTFVAPESLIKELHTGSSVSVNGVCLTVVKKQSNLFSVEMMPETIKKTAFGTAKEKEKVNLELPMKANSRFEGHIVQGHVDGIGKISSIKKEKNSWIFSFLVSNDLSKYIVPKGSIAVNGISLTIIDSSAGSFSVGIIPYTFTHTMLHVAHVYDKVNIETDIFAKYVKRLLL